MKLNKNKNEYCKLIMQILIKNVQKLMDEIFRHIYTVFVCIAQELVCWEDLCMQWVAMMAGVT
jgi:hypothetical protein